MGENLLSTYHSFRGSETHKFEWKGLLGLDKWTGESGIEQTGENIRNRYEIEHVYSCLKCEYSPITGEQVKLIFKADLQDLDGKSYDYNYEARRIFTAIEKGVNVQMYVLPKEFVMKDNIYRTFDDMMTNKLESGSVTEMYDEKRCLLVKFDMFGMDEYGDDPLYLVYKLIDVIKFREAEVIVDAGDRIMNALDRIKKSQERMRASRFILSSHF